MGMSPISTKNGDTTKEALYLEAPPPARNIALIRTRKEPSRTQCAVRCLSEECVYFEYADDTGECITKKLA